MKQQIIDEIIRVEGGYVNDPNDSGGETNFGITEQVARAAGYSGHMRDMPRELAFEIYAAQYWDAVRADDLAALSERVAAEVVDTGVNCGQGKAAEFLQRSLNVFNRRGILYSDIKVDHSIGPVTVAALRAYLSCRDELVLLETLNSLQGAFYVELAERREKDEEFVYGQIKERVKL